MRPTPIITGGKSVMSGVNEFSMFSNQDADESPSDGIFQDDSFRNTVQAKILQGSDKNHSTK